MKCHNCKKQGTIFQHTNRYLCNSCFSNLFEKRIRKFTRINSIFKPKDKVLVHDDVSHFILKSISKNIPLTLFAKKPKNKSIGKEIIQWTADDESANFLSAVFNNKKPRNYFSKNKVSVLLPVTDHEAQIFAKLHSLRFTPNKKDKSSLLFIQEIEKNSPGIKHTLANNLQLLNRLTA